MDTTNCEICECKLSKYLCPKCKIKYCSLECYKSSKHFSCSEIFFKNCILDNIDSAEIPEELATNIDELLKNEECSDDENNGVESLDERIGDLDLDHDTEEIWSLLTEEEKGNFFKFIESDDIKSYVKLWKPWWIFDVVEESDKVVSKPPKICDKFVDISKLKVSPSPLCRNTVVETLLCYSYICRRFNGDHMSLWEEAGDVAADICSCLEPTEAIPGDIDATVAAFLLTATGTRQQMNSKFLLLLLDDVAWFLRAEERQKRFVEAAFSDLWRLLRRSSHKLPQRRRKLEFLGGWVASGTLQPLLSQLQDEVQIAKMTNVRV